MVDVSYLVEGTESIATSAYRDYPKYPKGVPSLMLGLMSRVGYQKKDSKLN